MPRFVAAGILCILALLLAINVANASNEAVGAEIRQRFETAGVSTGSIELNGRVDELAEFYRARSFKPIWVRDNGPKGKAKALFVELGRSVVHGLDPALYRTEKIAALMGSTDVNELADLEFLFSGALFEYAHDLSNGRVSADRAPDQNMVEPIRHSVHSILDGAEKAGELRVFVSSLLNVDDRYVRLISKIEEFDTATTAGLWPDLSEGVPAVSEGESRPLIATLRQHFLLTGDFPPTGDISDEMFNRQFSETLSRYQARHGLEVTGRLDAGTRAVLEEGTDALSRKIGINLDRRRWQNRELGDDHVYVNLADESVRVVLDGEKQADLRLKNSDQLAALPTVYGIVTAVRNGEGGESPGLVFEPAAGGDLPERMMLPLHNLPEELVAMMGLQEGSGSGETTLAEPLTAFITYVTAWANKDGSVHFRPDRLNRDEIVMEVLGR